MNTRALAVAVTIGILFGGFPDEGAAQRSRDLRAGLPAPTRVLSQGDRGSLDAPLHLRLDQVDLSHALERIAREAGLDLAYVSDMLPPVRVSLPGRGTTARLAFRTVLDGTGLRVAGPTSSGHFVVVPAPLEEAPRSVDGTIVGRVYERSAGTPLAGVQIWLEGSDRSTVSGSDGRFALTGVPAGVWTLKATSIGYSEVSRTVEVRDGESVAAEFALETSAVSLDEIVVTGTVTPTPIKAVPTPITVIRATDIERQNIRSVDELFRVMIPGGVQTVQSPGPGGFAEFAVRGVSSLTIFSTIKVLLDGVELENPAYIKAIDPASIERVEFISGPQASATYGSGAVSGVMQVFTRKGIPGQRRPVVNGSVAYGTIDGRWVESAPLTQEYRLSVNGGEESYGYNLGGSWEEETGWIPDAHERGGSLYGSARLDLGDLTANILLRYRGDFDRTGRDPRSAIVFQDTYEGPNNEHMDWHSQTYGANFQYRASDRWSHELALGFDGGSTEQYTTAPRRATPADTFGQLVVFNRRKTSLRYNTSYRVPLGEHALTVIGGGDYASQSLVGLTGYSLPGSQRPTGSYPTIGGSRSVQTLAGAFGQGQLDLADRLFLTLGVHGDMSDGQDGVEFSPRVGASFVQPVGAAELKLRGAYGSALIAPDPANKAGSVGAGFAILGNPGLKPERQVGYDAGVELYWGNRASLSFTYFDQEARDLVSLTFVNFTTDLSEFQYQNVGTIRNRGWEVSGTLVPIPSLELTGVFGATTSEVESLSESYTGPLGPGDELQRVPDWTAAGTVAWRPFSGTTLTGNMTHRASWIESDFEARIGALFGGTFTGNVKDYWVDYEPITKLGLGVSQELSRTTSGFMRVENLTNNYNYEGHDLITPRGRELQVGVRFTFD